MQPDLIGGRYRVQSAIGRGGMGTVWLCRDETLHREVAVKQVGLIPGESVTDSARAFREARSSAGLSHRNVVTIFDVVEESGHVWLVMEYVRGRSLSQIIKQDGPLDPALVADIGAQVADGLATLHAVGIMHRDVKPGNVLVREDGVAKISDFGIARAAGDATLTQSGHMTGTPSYFSPHLAQGGEPGPADDVWALGATLYAAVEGRSPYERRSNPVAVLHDIVSDQPPRPQHADFLEPALERMLDRDPASRWSMQDAGHVLRKLADGHPLDVTLERTLAATAEAPATGPAPRTAPPSAVPPPPSAPQDQRRTRQQAKPPYVVLAVVALLFVAALSLVTRALTDSPRDEEAGDSPRASTSDEAATVSSSGPDAKEAFVRDYYEKAPGGSDEAWAMLGPGLQEQGRGAYDGFWRTIESVEVLSARAEKGSNEVAVTLRYRSTDSRVSTENKVETLVDDGDGFLLESDEPAG
jgi:serine/threonine protein kinase